MGKPDDMALRARDELLFRKEFFRGYGIKNEDLDDSVGRRTTLEKYSPGEFQSDLGWPVREQRFPRNVFHR